MPEPPTIRDAASTDAPALAALLAELGFPADTATIAARLGSLHHPVLVAELSGRIVALAALHITPVLHRPAPVGRITALVVSSAARRQGLGRALVAGSERRLAAVGCGLIEITSNHTLTEAHAFYQRLGYAATSHRFCKTLHAP